MRGGRQPPREGPRRDAASPGLRAAPHRPAAAWEHGRDRPRRRWDSGHMSSSGLAAARAVRPRPSRRPRSVPAGRCQRRWRAGTALPLRAGAADAPGCVAQACKEINTDMAVAL